MDLSFEVKQAIEQQVKVLLKNYGYSEERDSCLDIVDFVQTHEFVVGNAELDDNEDGFLAIQPMESPKNTGNVPYGKVIGVNSKRTLNWKRFIIAHEFAHSVLHYEDGNIYLHRENKKGKEMKKTRQIILQQRCLCQKILLRECMICFILMD